MNAKARKVTFAALLAVVTILAIQPSLAHATPQPVTLQARGIATAMGNSTETASTSASITLIGMGSLDGGNIQLTQMTGILQIGPVFYTITGGQGQSNNQTNGLQLNLQVGGSQPGTLVLQGTLQGNTDTVLFTPQQSNLENQYSLWLYGNVWLHQ